MPTTQPIAPGERQVRQKSFWFRIHFWIGWIAAAPVVIVCLTGAALVFQNPVSSWEMRLPEPVTEQLPPHKVIELLGAENPPLRVNHLTLPTGELVPYKAYVSETSSEGVRRGFKITIHPATGRITRPEDQFSAVEFVTAWHRRLAAGKIGQLVVGISSLILAITSIVGVFLWWPMRKRTFRRTLGRGSALDWHNSIGVIALLPLIVMALTGITFTWGKHIFPVLERIEGRPLVETPPKVDPPANAGKLPLETIFSTIARNHSQETIAAIQPSGGKAAPHVIFLRTESEPKRIFVDPYTGSELLPTPVKAGLAGWYKQNFGALHTLHGFPKPLQIVWGTLSLSGAVLAITGIVATVRRRRTTARKSSL